MALNCDYRHFLEAQRGLFLHQADRIDDALAELRCVYRAWDALDDAQRHRRNPELFLSDLRRLLSLIGPERFWSGRMPPPTPLFR